MADVVVFGVAAADVILRVPHIPGPGDHVPAEALGWRIGGSSANVACGLASAGHHVRLVGPVGSDVMGDHLIAALQRCGVDTEWVIRLSEPAPRTLVVLDRSGERTILSIDAVLKASMLPERLPDLKSVDCVYVEGYTRYPTDIATTATSALLVTSPPEAGATTWPAEILVGSETQYPTDTSRQLVGAMRGICGERLMWVVVTRGQVGADAYAETTELHVDAVPAEQVDSTGAGDAFTAGLLHALLRGDDMGAALNLGAAWSAATVAQLQSIPVAWEELAGPGERPGPAFRS